MMNEADGGDDDIYTSMSMSMSKSTSMSTYLGRRSRVMGLALGGIGSIGVGHGSWTARHGYWTGYGRYGFDLSSASLAILLACFLHSSFFILVIYHIIRDYCILYSSSALAGITLILYKEERYGTAKRVESL